MKLFINIVKHWAKKCRLLAKNVRHGCHSCILRVEENFLRLMNCFKKIYLLINFMDYEWKHFGPLEKKFAVCFLKKPFTSPEEWSTEYCLVKDWFFSKNFHILSQSFFHLGGKISEVLSKLHSTCPEELFPFLEKYKLLFFFRFLSKIVSAFLSRAFSAWLSKVLSWCLGHFLRKMNCFDKKSVFLTFSRSLSGSFSDFCCHISRHGFQKCILHVQNNVLRRSLLWKHVIFWYFWAPSWNFQGFAEKNMNTVVRNAF